MILNRVKIKYFKSFIDVDLFLNLPIIALIGLNGAGKSNILETIKIALGDDINEISFLQNRNVDYLDSDSHIVLTFLCNAGEYERLNRACRATVKAKRMLDYYAVDLNVSYFVKKKLLMRYVIDVNLRKVNLISDHQSGIVAKMILYFRHLFSTKQVVNNQGYYGYLIKEINENYLFDYHYIEDLEAYLARLEALKIVKMLKGKKIDQFAIFRNMLPKHLLHKHYFEDNKVMQDHFVDVFRRLLGNQLSQFNSLSYYGFDQVVDLSLANGQLNQRMPLYNLSSVERINATAPTLMALLNMTSNQGLLDHWSFSLRNVDNLISKLNQSLKCHLLTNSEALQYSIDNDALLLNVVKSNAFVKNETARNKTGSFGVDKISMGTKDLLLYELLLANYYQHKIILLDEPDCYLHISSQQQLVTIINAATKHNNKIIFTTHSPFMLSENMLCSTFLVEHQEQSSTVLNIEQLNFADRKQAMLHKENSSNLLAPFLSKLGFYDTERNFIANREYLLVEGKTDVLALQIIDLILNGELLNRFTIKYIGGIINLDKVLANNEAYFDHITLLADNDATALTACEPYLHRLHRVIFIYDDYLLNMDSVFKLSSYFREIWDKNYPKLRMKLPVYTSFLDLVSLAKMDGTLDKVIPASLAACFRRIYHQLLDK